MSVVINARFLTQPITGVQRYAVELSKELRRLRPDLRFVAPRTCCTKTSPNNSGPKSRAA